MKKRIRQHINHLREQPDHVRMRAALRWTAIGGTCIAIAWLAVLLPLQLRVHQAGEKKTSDGGVLQVFQRAFQAASESQPINSDAPGQVAGEQTAQPAPTASPLSSQQLQLPSAEVSTPTAIPVEPSF